MTKRGPKPVDPEKRFWNHVRKTADCWLWTGGNNERYGVFFAGGDRTRGKVLAHKWSFEHHFGPVPEGLEVNHRCEVTLCVRPDHLEELTPRDNVRYGTSHTANKARQTHCVNNHEFTPENTYIRSNGTRACKACRRGRMAELRASRTR